MKKFLLTRAVITIVFGLNFSALDVPTVTLEQDLYPIRSDGKFEIFVKDGLPDRSAGTSLQSFCLEMNEYLSFGETCFVDVSDVTLNGVREVFSPDSLEPDTDTQLIPAS